MIKTVARVPRKVKRNSMAICQNEKCGHRWFTRSETVPRQCPKCWSDRVVVEKTA